jgi:hypothetical protein
MDSPKRRRLLQAIGALATGSVLAGCQTGTDGSGTVTSTRTPAGTPSPTQTATATPESTPEETPESTPSDEDVAALKERARSFLRLFVDESFEEAHRRLVEQAAGQISPEQLAEVWAQLTESNGAFVEFASVEYRGRQRGLDVFVAQLTFERGQQQANVALADDGVAGIRFPPGANWQPPAYVDRSAFTEQELSLSAPGDCSLGATLSMPTGDGDAPGVVLVHGNGAQDRDQTIGPNKTFKELAWGLATQGVAVLRYDKRTFACDVDRADATIDDIVTDDALTAIDRLRSVERIPDGDVMVVGHSIGGTLAPRIAARDGNLAGVVMLAALARPIADAIEAQQEHLANLDNVVTDEEQKALERGRRIAEQIRTLDIADDEVVNSFGGDEYYRTLQEYDHLQTAAELSIPRLVVQGGSDWQVTDEADLPLWREAMAGQENVQFEVYPDLNHRFQESEGKETQQEYFEDESVAEEVVVTVAQFVLNNT